MDYGIKIKELAENANCEERLQQRLAVEDWSCSESAGLASAPDSLHNPTKQTKSGITTKQHMTC